MYIDILEYYRLERWLYLLPHPSQNWLGLCVGCRQTRYYPRILANITRITVRQNAARADMLERTGSTSLGGAGPTRHQ